MYKSTTATVSLYYYAVTEYNKYARCPVVGQMFIQQIVVHEALSSRYKQHLFHHMVGELKTKT